MKKSVLIFGVSGFVGGYLSEEFYDNGYEVYGADLRKDVKTADCIRYYDCDLLDKYRVDDIIRSLKPDCIVNLAAVSSVSQSWKEPQKTVAVNVEGTLNIFEAVRKSHATSKILIVGSSEEYEVSDKPLCENSALSANNPYGISKVMQEQFCRLYRERFGMRIYSVRSFNHTGIGQSHTFVIPSWCRQVAEISKSGKSGAIKVGNIDVERDFTDVRDVARAYRMIIESDDCNAVYNVGSGNAVSLRDLLNHIISLSDYPVEVEVDSALIRPVDNSVICCCNKLITERIGWKPRHDIFETVKDLYEYYLNQSQQSE